MIKPLKNNVIIKRVDAEQTTSFGIILESSSQTPKAKVLAVGSTVEDVAVDDVIIPDWTKVKAAGDYLVVDVENILMVL
jgi:co-chaperonin GroES (HSP10)